VPSLAPRAGGCGPSGALDSGVRRNDAVAVWCAAGPAGGWHQPTHPPRHPRASGDLRFSQARCLQQTEIPAFAGMTLCMWNERGSPQSPLETLHPEDVGGWTGRTPRPPSSPRKRGSPFLASAVRAKTEIPAFAGMTRRVWGGSCIAQKHPHPEVRGQQASKDPRRYTARGSRLAFRLAPHHEDVVCPLLLRSTPAVIPCVAP